MRLLQWNAQPRNNMKYVKLNETIRWLFQMQFHLYSFDAFFDIQQIYERFIQKKNFLNRPIRSDILLLDWAKWNAPETG